METPTVHKLDDNVLCLMTIIYSLLLKQGFKYNFTWKEHITLYQYSTLHS